MDANFQEIRCYLLALNDADSMLAGLVTVKLLKSRRPIAGEIQTALSLAELLSLPPAQEKDVSFLHFPILVLTKLSVTFAETKGLTTFKFPLC
ncbi:hypothetical protein HZS_7485 [Henneguya salminicola]|nr:hypothetical protein HZS_7485 [Henneguya salminicola]